MTCDQLKIQFSGAQQKESLFAQAPGAASPAGSPAQARIVDIQAFKQEKQPSSANEMAAVVAYYLSELAPQPHHKSEVDTTDMEKYFKQAGFPLPGSLKDLLNRAMNAGYFDRVDRGKFKLNPVGYNLVAHNLPRASSSSPVVSRRVKARASQKRAGRKRGR
ncbi:MAG: hypothetical protein HY848_12115 [Betaproteobacteria bacterium]|nr:hypothetical protein [Betaproteobacteria bacterium]